MADKKRLRDKKKKAGTKKPATKKGRQLVTVQSEKYFDIPGRMTTVSLELPNDLSYEEWAMIGHRLNRIGKFTQWALGDWLNYGEGKHGEKYTQASSELGKAVSTLQAYKWVSLRIEPSRRIEELEWYHHRVVASLEDLREQDRWLKKSVENGWTIRELKDALRNTSREANDAGTGDQKSANKCVRCYEHEAVFSVCNECFGTIPDRKPAQDKSAA